MGLSIVNSKCHIETSVTQGLIVLTNAQHADLTYNVQMKLDCRIPMDFLFPISFIVVFEVKSHFHNT